MFVLTELTQHNAFFSLKSHEIANLLSTVLCCAAPRTCSLLLHIQFASLHVTLLLCNN